jgi:hypothetical protein
MYHSQPMSGFPGGSAWAMARDISSGYLRLNERTLARFNRGQIGRLTFEIDKLLREVRGEQPDLTDVNALRKRNQRIQRLTTGRRLIESALQRRR